MDRLEGKVAVVTAVETVVSVWQPESAFQQEGAKAVITGRSKQII